MAWGFWHGASGMGLLAWGMGKTHRSMRSGDRAFWRSCDDAHVLT
jgi:hypothetical protein